MYACGKAWQKSESRAAGQAQEEAGGTFIVKQSRPLRLPSFAPSQKQAAARGQTPSLHQLTTVNGAQVDDDKSMPETIHDVDKRRGVCSVAHTARAFRPDRRSFLTSESLCKVSVVLAQQSRRR